MHAAIANSIGMAATSASPVTFACFFATVLFKSALIYSNSFISFAGCPPYKQLSGTSFTTNEPAAIMEFFPIQTPFMIIQFIPIQTFSFMVIGWLTATEFLPI